MMPGANSRNIQLTANFRLSEFLHGETMLPPDWILENLHRLANRLQVIRDLLGKPIIINSGYRSPTHNKRVGGALHSQHLSGMAVDIVIPGMAAAEVQKFLRHWSGGMGLYEHYTHLDIRPSRTRWGGSYRPGA